MGNINWRGVVVFGIAMVAIVVTAGIAAQHLAIVSGLVMGVIGLLTNLRNGSPPATGDPPAPGVGVAAILLLAGAMALGFLTSCSGGQGPDTTDADEPSWIEELLSPLSFDSTSVSFSNTEGETSADVIIYVYKIPVTLSCTWNFNNELVKTCLSGRFIPGGRLCRSWATGGAP